MSKKNRKPLPAGFVDNNRVKLIRGGKDYFDLLVEMIEGAEETIHLQVYILDEDETGQLVVNALKAAASRQVKVYVMVDGYASQGLSKEFVQSIRDAGIHFRFFSPLLKSKYFYFGRRLHHKVVVVDNQCALIGGLNISNRYNDLPGQMAWLDFALYVEGMIARDLCVLCWKSWKSFPARMPKTPCEAKELHFNFSEEENSQVRMRRNDWVRNKDQVSRTYIEMFTHARSNITILSSYFLPGTLFRKALRRAIKKGVKVRVIIAGLSDIMISKNAERYLYDWLLRNKIEVYEYNQQILHGKMASCDGEWITIGSYNVNNISAFASIELNLDVKNKNFTRSVDKTLDQIIKDHCTVVTAETLKKSTNVFKRVIRWSSYIIIRFMFYLFTFYYRKQK
jgi:cardiolipin synthase